MLFTLKQALALIKPVISFAVALSSLTAYILCVKKIDIYGLYLLIGVFSFAAFALILNQIQERKYDKLMSRTKNRPIPTRKFSVKESYILAIILAIVGSVFFSFFQNSLVYLLVVATILFYNFIYTPLKRISVLTILPGAVVGSIPPLIGWAAGNGNFSSLSIWILAFFFFMGQIPHFALLSLKFGKDFKQAGFPIVTDYLSREQIKNITFIWIFSVGIIALALALQAKYLYYLIFAAFVYLTISTFLWKHVTKQQIRDRKIFLELNLFFLLVMVVLCVQVFI